MRRTETELDRSELAWVSPRPPRLLDKPPTGSYRLDADRPLPKASSITTPTSPPHSSDAPRVSQLDGRAVEPARDPAWR